VYSAGGHTRIAGQGVIECLARLQPATAALKALAGCIDQGDKHLLALRTDLHRTAAGRTPQPGDIDALWRGLHAGIKCRHAAALPHAGAAIRIGDIDLALVADGCRIGPVVVPEAEALALGVPLAGERADLALRIVDGDKHLVLGRHNPDSGGARTVPHAVWIDGERGA